MKLSKLIAELEKRKTFYDQEVYFEIESMTINPTLELSEIVERTQSEEIFFRFKPVRSL